VIEAMQALLADWLAAQPWGLASNNVHETIVQGHLVTPVLAVAMLVLPLALAWRWRRGRGAWPGVLALVAVGWLLLDLPWQWELASRLADSRERFAGVPAAERPGRGGHALPWSIARFVRPIVEASPGRIFVASRHEASGMFTAYYLYPLNPYWERGGPELPAAAAMRPGDYLLLVRPTGLRIDRDGENLVGYGAAWPVRPIVVRPWGALLRVR
jgi:hypothetical protein